MTRPEDLASAQNSFKEFKKAFEQATASSSSSSKDESSFQTAFNLLENLKVALTHLTALPPLFEQTKSKKEELLLAGEHMVNYMRWVCHWRGLGNHMDPGEELPETKGKLDLLNYDFLHKRNMLFGTPEYVIDKIHELKSELNLQNLQVWSNFPGVKHKDCMKSIKLFTEKVIPHFKDDLDTEVKKVS